MWTPRGEDLCPWMKYRSATVALEMDVTRTASSEKRRGVKIILII